MGRIGSAGREELVLLCASCDRSGRSAWPELAPGVDCGLDKAKISSDRRIDADRPRLCAVFEGGKTSLHSLDPKRTFRDMHGDVHVLWLDRTERVIKP
jgi:hypothetical protein